MTVRVLLAGGTGLVGSLVADALASRTDVEVLSLVRAPTRSHDRKIDFDALVAAPAGTVGAVDIDVGISCLGTTIRKAGSQAAFRRVDHDYVFAVARAARENGARQFILMSSVGAGGRAFYLRAKGEVEEAVRSLGFERLDIIRPGLLLGDRAERRIAERLAQAAMPVLNPLLRGQFEKYAAVPAAAVAKAIVRLVGSPGSGVHIAHTREIVGESDRSG